eukprot:CAMPEP_0178866418 /NCGR_PEP_ID=MMETSP0747-20121128/4935_1 /TAXON_ID=913974 /ORGANISM="Nitzschia punctata, Strain CCMP561" /LENGTH=34 /DNA_ID= /DNA_START= /DNA_END= /DNA_ORIENTATION=
MASNLVKHSDLVVMWPAPVLIPPNNPKSETCPST